MDRLIVDRVSFQMLKSEMILRGFEFDEKFEKNGRIECDEGLFTIFKASCNCIDYDNLISTGLANSSIIPFGVGKPSYRRNIFGVMVLLHPGTKIITVNYLDKSNQKCSVIKTKNYKVSDFDKSQLCLLLLDNLVGAQYIRFEYTQGIFGQGVRVMDYTLYQTSGDYTNEL